MGSQERGGKLEEGDQSAFVNYLATRDVNHKLSGLILITILYEVISHPKVDPYSHSVQQKGWSKPRIPPTCTVRLLMVMKN